MFLVVLHLIILNTHLAIMSLLTVKIIQNIFQAHQIAQFKKFLGESYLGTP